MDNVLAVDVHQSLADLVDVTSSDWLRVVAARLIFQVLIELTTWTILKDQVNLFIVIKEAIKLHNVFVSQVALNLNFSSQLIGNFLAQQLLLVKNLERDYKFAFPLPGQVDVAKLATTKRLSDFEVVNGPLSAIKVTENVVFFLSYVLLVSVVDLLDWSLLSLCKKLVKAHIFTQRILLKRR